MTSRALNSSYTHGPIQRGGMNMNTTKKLINNVLRANQWALDNKIATNTKGYTDNIGLTGYLDRKSNGLYSKGANYGISQGYGKPRKTRKKKAKK
jgi:hypothetical protein